MIGSSLRRPALAAWLKRRQRGSRGTSRRARWLAVAPCLALDIFAGPAMAASTSPVWPTATTVEGVDAALVSVSCPRWGSCVAVGPGNSTLPSVVAETRGTWGRATQVKPPANGLDDGAAYGADLNSVACTGPGQCVAAGSYTDTAGNTQAMIIASVSSFATVTKETISNARHTAKFTFEAEGSASGFQCALVRVPRGRHRALPPAHYTTCATSKTYRALAAGTFVFDVRTSGGSDPDPTPASRTFAVA
jgi:hypothetical protein